MEENRYSRWTSQEDEILRQFYGLIPRRQLKDKFIGRSSLSLTKRAKILGLRAKKNIQSAKEADVKRSESAKKTRQDSRNRNFSQELFTGAKGRAKKAGLEFSLSVEDIKIPAYCPLLGIKLIKGSVDGRVTDNSPSIDRKDSKRGYTKDNIWIISYRANRIKNDATFQEFKNICTNWEKETSHPSFDIYSQNVGKFALIIGDSCDDRWKIGVVRINPESPTLTFKETSEKHNIGMAGNVFENTKSLFPDFNSLMITQESLIQKTRYIDDTSKYILFRVDNENEQINSISVEQFFERLKVKNLKIDNIQYVIFSDYNKGFLKEDVIEKLAKYFEHKKITTFLDTKKTLGEWSKNIDFVKINLKEYNHQIENIKEPTNFCKNLIVTLGSDGCKWINKDISVAGEPANVVSQAGCGDTFLAAFAGKYQQTKDVVEAMKYGNKAAAIAVSKHGVVAVKSSDISF